MESFELVYVILLPFSSVSLSLFFTCSELVVDRTDTLQCCLQEYLECRSDCSQYCVSRGDRVQRPPHWVVRVRQVAGSLPEWPLDGAVCSVWLILSWHSYRYSHFDTAIKKLTVILLRNVEQRLGGWLLVCSKLLYIKNIYICRFAFNLYKSAGARKSLS